MFMDTISISDLRNNLPSLIKDIAVKLNRLVITVSGKPKAVVMSLEEMESLQETAEILAIPGSWQKIKKGSQEAKEGKGIPLDKFDWEK